MRFLVCEELHIPGNRKLWLTSSDARIPDQVLHVDAYAQRRSTSMCETGCPMKSSRRLRQLFLTAGLSAALLPATADDGAPAKVKAKVESLQRTLNEKPDSDPDWKEVKSDVEASLKQTTDALRGGFLYVSLESLSGAIVTLRGMESANAKSEAEVLKEGLPGVDKELEKARLKLAALDQNKSQQNLESFPLAIRAISEKAKGEADPLMVGGRGFAAMDGLSESDRTKYLDSSMFYVGIGEAVAEIVTFEEGLGLRREGSLVPLRSVSQELRHLQEQVTASYQPPLTVDHHAEFIHLNATLKLAGELDGNQSYAGALFEYLDAVQQFGMLKASAPDAARQSELRHSVEQMHHELNASKQDSSLAQLFLERAEARLSKSPSADDWKLAGVIVDQVLPAYSATLKSPPPADQPAVAGVTVTLVRWPYT